MIARERRCGCPSASRTTPCRPTRAEVCGKSENNRDRRGIRNAQIASQNRTRRPGSASRHRRRVLRGACVEQHPQARVVVGQEGAVRVRRRSGRRPLHAQELPGHGSQDHDLRRDHPVRQGPGPPRTLRERHPGLRQPHGLRRAKPVLRLHHGPVREPDRTRQVHARRRHLPAADQQPAELASRRNRRLRQAHLGDHGDPEPRRRRSQDDVHEPAPRPGLSGHAASPRSSTS